MIYKRLMIGLLLIIAICLIFLVIYFVSVGDQVKSSKVETGLPPKFEDYPSSVTLSMTKAGLDFSSAPEVQKYYYEFIDNRDYGKPTLASTYHTVALPCDGDANLTDSDCYTLWIFDAQTGHVLKVGQNHYFPTEVHTNSRLIKSGDEYYVVEGDSIRLVYVR